MSQRYEDKRQTELARIRTELAHERTRLAYMRTAASLILFGIAFLGFRAQSQLYLYTGWTAVILGVFMFFISLERMWKYQKEIRRIKKLLSPKRLFKRD